MKIDSLEDNNLIINESGGSQPNINSRPLKSGKNRKPLLSGKKAASQDQLNSSYGNDDPSTINDINDPRERLLKLQELVVGGEQANNEELKKKRIKKKKHAEERKQLLAESLRNGDDDEFMLSVYDSVQEEVKFKTKQLDKEKAQVKFLENEVKDLQHEFEREREEYLDTIRKQEKQLKLMGKIMSKLQPIIPHDCNYYNLDKVQTVSVWNEEHQDWLVPELKREKLSLPSMNNNTIRFSLILIF